MKQNFNFDVNIEKRMPQTGLVFYVERMTSDYAIAHPFNVDEFIEQVFQHWKDDPTPGFAATREELQRLWTDVLSVTSPSGDASLYPNKDNGHHPALMEVWHKAGDYWRRGFRIGDVLPTIVPGHNITRLADDEWISLSPKDAVLLDAASEECRVKSEESDNIEPAGNQCSPTPSDESVQSVESVVEKKEPVELDLFAQMQMQIDQLRVQNEELRMKNEEFCNMIQERTEVRTAQDVFDNENCSCVMQGQNSTTPRPRRQRKPRKPRYEVPAESVAVAISQPEPMINTEDILKWLGLTIGAVVLMIVIFKTGLLIPLGLIGLGLGGILK